MSTRPHRDGMDEVRGTFVVRGGWYWAGFGHEGYDGITAVPFWLLASLAGLPLTWAVIVRRRRSPPGHCPSCGYDLTANESGRCPECGSEAPAGIT